MDRKSEDPRTLPPQRGRSQQRGGCSDLYVARIARQVRASHAPLAAKGHLIPTAKWLLAVAHGRLQSHSLAPRQHLPRSTPERLEASATAGHNRFAYESGLLRRGTRANEEPHITFSGPPLETVPSHRSVSAIPMGLGRNADGERPWRFGDSVKLKWIPTLLPLASNPHKPRL